MLTPRNLQLLALQVYQNIKKRWEVREITTAVEDPVAQFGNPLSGMDALQSSRHSAHMSKGSGPVGRITPGELHVKVYRKNKPHFLTNAGRSSSFSNVCF